MKKKRDTFAVPGLAMRRSLLALSIGTLLAGAALVLPGVRDSLPRSVLNLGMLALFLSFVSAMFAISLVALGKRPSPSASR